MKLTPGFTITDFQATPSGYYQIAFRNTRNETIVSTQHGRGGSNFYTPHTLKADLDEWLASNAQIAIDLLTELGFPDLAKAIIERSWEWQDSIVMSLADLIDMNELRIEG